MAKAKESKQEIKNGTEKDPATGLRTGTKKFVVYQCWKAKKSLEDGTKAALKHMGKHDAAGERSTRGSVRSWYREFDRRFST